MKFSLWPTTLTGTTPLSFERSLKKPTFAEEVGNEATPTLEITLGAQPLIVASKRQSLVGAGAAGASLIEGRSAAKAADGAIDPRASKAALLKMIFRTRLSPGSQIVVGCQQYAKISEGLKTPPETRTPISPGRCIFTTSAAAPSRRCFIGHCCFLAKGSVGVLRRLLGLE